MKKFFSLAAVFLIVFIFLPVHSGAVNTDAIQAQIDSIQEERTRLLEQQKKLLSALEDLGKQSQSLNVNIKQLNATRTKLLNDLKVTESGMKKADLTIQKLSLNINQNEEEISIHKSAIEEAVKTLNNYDTHTLLYDLLTYKNISEVWTDATDLDTLQDKLQDEIANLRGVQRQLAENKQQQEEQKKSLKSLAAELSGQKQVIEQTKTAKEKLLSQTKNQESEYQKMLAENIKREKEFEAQLFQYQMQLKASAPGSAPSAAKGVLSWPISPVKITQQFGKTSSSGRLYASGTHNGMDFGAPVGTPVLSARTGVVKGQGNTDSQAGCYSYGRWVLIEHDNGLSTLYAHLSASTVSTGQAVTTGQVIGYSGGQPGAYGSGYSTGPHLHFTVYVSAGVRIQQYSTSINCKSVSIPIANPTDYLDPAAYLPR
jgi:murein DD-endopeptidase MepM/ murein hydrolase activator NlpD